MAKITVSRPEPVTPPATYTLELSEHEALYIAGVLGAQYKDDTVFAPLMDALEESLGTRPSYAPRNPTYDAVYTAAKPQKRPGRK